MFIPYSTDAPVYHWPFATVGLIVVNVVLFLAMSAGVLPADPETGAPWFLQYGDGLRPQEWFGSLFMHFGYGHLIGNMLFLWVFGLVVEGKLGAQRFLACYLFVGVGEAFLEQLFMLGYTGNFPGSAGASAAIYGLMVMAILWAPDNEISFVFWFIYPFPGEAKIIFICGLFVALDVGMVILLWGYAASSIYHVIGAALGWAIGYRMLRAGVVDCEGWDLFTRYGNKRKSEEDEPAEDPSASAELEAVKRTSVEARFDESLSSGAPLAALQILKVATDEGVEWRPDTERLRKLVRGLYNAGQWAEVAPLMARLIEEDPESADGLRVALAQLCTRKLERPGRALEILQQIDERRLSDKQRATVADTRRHAEHSVAEGTLEIDQPGW